jgi:hypothetical protein
VYANGPVVSGEFCTIPNGTAAPGTVKPTGNVPIIGSTWRARPASGGAASACDGLSDAINSAVATTAPQRFFTSAILAGAQ